MPEELFLPFEFPNRTPPATHVRSTLIVSSMQALRARGLFDAYLSHLPADARAELLSLVAGVWIPVALGTAHYLAADRLGLDPQTVESIGGDVGERVNKTILSLAVKLSKEAGVTTWSALARAHKLREYSWRGGDLAVWKLGPKDARVEWLGMPYTHIPYCAIALGGFIRSLIGLFCTKAYVKLQPTRASEPPLLSYRLSWA